MDSLKNIKLKNKKINRPGKKVQFKIKINLWKMILGTILLIFFIPFIVAVFQLKGVNTKLDISQALTDIKEGKVKEVVVQDEKLILTYKDDSVKTTTKESKESFTDLLDKEGIKPTSVKYSVVDQSTAKVIGDVTGIVLPIILMAAFFLFIIKAQNKGARDIFSFGKSKAKLFAKGKQNVTFEDVAGVEYAKNELVEIVDFLKNPAKYRRIGARTPKGVILFGPAGVGKTLLAKAVAGEAGVPFFSMAGSEFMEMLVGVGASVTGDTPVLVKEGNKIKLVAIGDFIDRFYTGNKKRRRGIIKVKGIQTLGLKPEKNKFYGSQSSKRPVFGGSQWQSIDAVYRHKAKSIYEIEYLGGRIRTTGDHSVFVREHGGIRAKEVRNLKKGDILVNLPMNTRKWDYKTKKTIHKIKKHVFPEKTKSIMLDVWQEDKELVEKYDYVMSQKGLMYQHKIADEVGISQMTVSNWQSGKHKPQRLSRKLVKLNLPEKAELTPSLMKLFGYYTAEGRGTHSLEFTFNVTETDYVQDVKELMEEVFGLDSPRLIFTNTNSVKVIYYSAHLGRFFAKYCGNGSHNKHVPPMLWNLPREYFLAYLEGYTNGDGYITKSGKLSMTSVSNRLILELSWLSSMHGMKVGIKHEIQKEGRSILRGKPLPETESWELIIGKTSNPFIKEEIKHPYQFKRAIVKKIIKKKYNDYVYDFCGVENEAFFGGEKPILLHNSRVRDLFSQAKAAAPAIIFIDEIDAIGRQRGRGFIGGHDEREQTLNQILVEMDGFTPNDNVIVIAATNRGDLLDPALLRPGRFDRRVMLDMPDKEGREAILKIHARGKKFAKGIKWAQVASRTVGFSGADLENMLNEAAIQAVKNRKREIGMDDIEEAATKVKLGPAKKRLQSKEDKKITAYHEGGHAIVTHFLSKMDPVERISIVARGMSLGHTLIPPAADRTHETKSRMLQQITAMLGGRAAEEMVFDEMTSGASNDIEKATQLARAMVVEFGMSDLGPINLGPQYDVDEMGKTQWYEPAHVSPAMQEKIDEEVKKIMDSSYGEALKIIKKYRKKLDKVANKLLKVETLDRQAFEKIVGKVKK